MKTIAVEEQVKIEFTYWNMQAKAVTGLNITQSQFVSFLLDLYEEHIANVKKE